MTAIVNRTSAAPLTALLACLALAGCGGGVSFPYPVDTAAAWDTGAWGAYDTDGDGTADFFTFVDSAGVASMLGYDTTGDGAVDTHVETAAIPFDRCRHLVLILDGFSYDLLKRWYDRGGLRVFHPPSRVVSPYPSMTDLGVVDALGTVPTAGFEARYFDRKANTMVGGNTAYLSGRNAPYNRLLQFRAPSAWDAAAYIASWPVFAAEINGAKDRFDANETREVIVYSVGSAGVGTREGADGQHRCLRRVEQLVHQVLWETRGRTKVTLLSDHGHSYTPATQIDLGSHLESRGWRLAGCLDEAKTAVWIRFGLVTYASFATNRPADLAADLVAAEGVELASYAQGRTVIVLGPNGAKAVISRKHSSYKYAPVSGDPLKLSRLLTTIPADAEGFRTADALLATTARHEYPAPLQRLWRAHQATATHRPDVIASLADRFFSGDASMTYFVDIASTHGGLNYSNSVTFIMSTAGPLPPVMRSADIPRHMQALTGSPFPLRK